MPAMKNIHLILLRMNEKTLCSKCQSAFITNVGSKVSIMDLKLGAVAAKTRTGVDQ